MRWKIYLFKAEQEAISGNHYTYQCLLNETLILEQQCLRRVRKLTEIGDDKLSGGSGNDRLVGGSGHDAFSCGPGNDTIVDFNRASGDTKTSDCEHF